MSENEELEAASHPQAGDDFRSLIKWVVTIVTIITGTVAAAVIIGGFAAYNRLSVMEQQIITLNTTVLEMRVKIETSAEDRFTGTEGDKHEKRIRDLERVNDAQAIEIRMIKEQLAERAQDE